ncbi:MAG TPA: PEP-CTERM sorting domain-containing protein [Candidatus Eisenbacteria bacterium]|nr:PEP-CTERM sorting domain-containing protein [Candidatus Eisenbacteria bacterium]
MRHNPRILAVAVLATFLFAVSLPGFATVASHIGGTSQPRASVTAAYSPALASPLIYFQNSDYNGAYASQNDTTGFGNFATSYDNFTLGASYNIDEVAWIGSYFNPPNQGTITGFTLTFYADNGGQPGAAIWSGFGSGNFGETFLGFDNAGDPTFLYDGLLGSPFAAAAGTQYWMSLVPDLAFPPQWGWETGVGGDGAAWQDFFGSGGSIPNDLSFALYGTQSTIPEPGSLVLMGTGLLGLAGVVRRKLF